MGPTCYDSMFSAKGEHSMEKKQKRAFSTIMALTADLAEIISGNIAGGALLANAFYIW